MMSFTDTPFESTQTGVLISLQNLVELRLGKPNAQITRDQMAVMVTRALKAAGKDISVSKSDQDSLLAKFTDKGKIASWAKADVAAAAKAGIVNGVTSTGFAPAAKATRAESATMLKRMMTTGELI
ncbi:MAG: S-layer homology domain-containing protein [Carboxydocellales bacterium]